MIPRRTAVLYVRGHDHARQQEALMGAAAGRYEILDTLVATGPDDTEGLLAGVRAGRWDAVLMTRMDRLGRNLSHMAATIASILQFDADLLFTEQGIDTSASNQCGRAQIMVLVAMAEYEKARHRERTARGMKTGRPAGRQSEKMPPEPERRRIIVAWVGEGSPGGLRELGRRLGGVAPSTALRAYRRMGPGAHP